MLDFTDKLILRNVYKSRELHSLTSAPSWGRLTTFSENGFPVAVTEEVLVEVIHFLLLEEDSARLKNFTVMFMMSMNINHRAIWPTVVCLRGLQLAKGMGCTFGIIWFRGHRKQELTFWTRNVLSWGARLAGTWDRTGGQQAVIRDLGTVFDFGNFECTDISLF